MLDHHYPTDIELSAMVEKVCPGIEKIVQFDDVNQIVRVIPLPCSRGVNGSRNRVLRFAFDENGGLVRIDED